MTDFCPAACLPRSARLAPGRAGSTTSFRRLRREEDKRNRLSDRVEARAARALARRARVRWASGVFGGRRSSARRSGSTASGGAPRDHRPCVHALQQLREPLHDVAPCPTLHRAPSMHRPQRETSFVWRRPRTTCAARATRVDSSAPRAPCPAGPRPRRAVVPTNHRQLPSAEPRQLPPSAEAPVLGRLVTQVGRTTPTQSHSVSSANTQRPHLGKMYLRQ